MADHRYESISVVVLAITSKAIQVKDGAQIGWIPKSLIEDEAEGTCVGECTDINVQEWFLKKEGYI